MPGINELIGPALQGDADAYDELIRLGYFLVRSRIRKTGYFLPPAYGDLYDLAQEGMIGFLSAIPAWNPNGGIAFCSFASVCIDRELNQAVRMAKRRKHEMLNSSERLDKPIPHMSSGRSNLTLMDVARPQRTDGMFRNPLQALMDATGEAEARLILAEFRAAIVPDFERFVLERCVIGLTPYKDAAEERRVHWKSIDNACQRVMRKLRKRALELSTDGRFSPETRAGLARCGEPNRRSGGRPPVTAWIGDLAKGA